MKATSVKVGEGDSVRITTLAYPEDVIAGKIDKVYNMLDEGEQDHEREGEVGQSRL